jgi:hypothetical protein
MGRKVSFRCSVMQHRRLLRPFSNSLSMLDFSQLGERGRGHASAISSKCSESFRRLRPAPLLATKLAVLRNGPLSEACSSTFRGALWARLSSTSSCGEKEAGALFEGPRDFLRIARAHRPEESLRAFMDPLADALCGAPKWLKSTSMHAGE